MSGADRLIAPDSPHARLVGPLTTLMTDTVGLRIQIMIGGAPRVVHHRLGMGIDRRLVFGLPDDGEYPALGVDRVHAGQLATPRRVVDLPAGRLTQLGRLTEPGRLEAEAIRAVAVDLPPARDRPPAACADISWPLPLANAGLADAAPPAALVAPIPVGIGLDDGAWSWIDATDDGPLFAIAGSPKSGRSTALAMLGTVLSTRGWRVVNLDHSRRSPLGSGPWEQRGLDAIASVVASDEPLVVLVDDLHRLESSDELLPVVQRERPTLLAVAASPSLIGSRTGVMRSLPAVSTGVLLAPRAPSDGTAIGLPRLPDSWLITPRAGRGVLAVAGEATQVQLPLVALEP